jgi:putative ABC transport system permease protein
MLWPVAKALLGHYRKHPLQMLLVWFGLTLGISIFVGVAAINQHSHQSYSDGDTLLSHSFPYKIQPKHSANKIPASFYEHLRHVGFNQCVPIDILRVHTKSGRDLSIVGIDPASMADFVSDSPLRTAALIELAQPPMPLLMSHVLAEYLGKTAGDYIQLNDGRRLGPIRLEHRNIVSGTRIIADMASIRPAQSNGGFSAIVCEQLSEQELSVLRALIPNGMSLSRSSKVGLESLTRAFHMNLSAMGMLSFVVGLFIFYQAMSLSFIQRQPLVGILRQAGVSGWQLTQALILELGVFILVGWGLGNAFGLLLANKLMPSVSTTLADLYNANVSLTIEWQWAWSQQSLLMAAVGTLLACAWPLIRLLRTQPIRLSARLSLVRFAGREFAWQAIVAGILCVISVGLYQLQYSFETGFIIVALLLMSVALFIPFVIFELFTRLSFSLPWVKARWFFADAAASMSFRGVAVMAFMLAMSANIAVETLVGSFRQTTESWLTQKLAADVYIYPTSRAAGQMSHWLTEQHEVDAVWWRWERDVSTTGGLIEVVSTGDSAGESEAVTVKLAIPDYWYHLHQGKSLMVSEAMAIKQGIRPGDVLAFGGGVGDGWKVVGIYYDYGNPHNQLLMSHRSWQQKFAGTGSVGLGVSLRTGVDPEQLLLRLKEKFQLPEARIFANKNIHNQAMRVFDRTFVIADTLGNITLVIAVFGIFFATVSGEVSKQRNFALLRCFGMSTRELIFLSSLQLFMFGIISALIAMPLGLALAAIMVDAVLKVSFGWTMHITVIPWEYLNTLGWTLLALMCAGVGPIVGMVRRAPMKSLRNAL